MQRTDFKVLLILVMMLGLVVLAGCPAGDEGGGESDQAAGIAPGDEERSPQAEQLELADEQRPEPEEGEKQGPTYDPGQPLNDQYQEMKARQNPPVEVKQMFADQQAAITEAGMLDSALGEGDTAPGFTLPADSGGAIALETALSDGPAVLVFFRGGW